MKSLVIAVVLLAAGGWCSMASAGGSTEVKSESETPRFSLSVSIGKNSREQFFSAIRSFSESHAFAYRIAKSDRNGEHYLVQLWREDVKLVAVNPFSATEFQVDIYNTCTCEPTLPQSQVLALGAELRQSISQVKSATFAK